MGGEKMDGARIILRLIGERDGRGTWEVGHKLVCSVKPGHPVSAFLPKILEKLKIPSLSDHSLWTLQESDAAVVELAQRQVSVKGLHRASPIDICRTFSDYGYTTTGAFIYVKYDRQDPPLSGPPSNASFGRDETLRTQPPGASDTIPMTSPSDNAMADFRHRVAAQQSLPPHERAQQAGQGMGQRQVQGHADPVSVGRVEPAERLPGGRPGPLGGMTPAEYFFGDESSQQDTPMSPPPQVAGSAFGAPAAPQAAPMGKGRVPAGPSTVRSSPTDVAPAFSSSFVGEETAWHHPAPMTPLGFGARPSMGGIQSEPAGPAQSAPPQASPFAPPAAPPSKSGNFNPPNFNPPPAPPQPAGFQPPPAPPQPSNFNPPPAPPQPATFQRPPAPPQPANFNAPPAPPQPSNLNPPPAPPPPSNFNNPPPAPPPPSNFNNPPPAPPQSSNFNQPPAPPQPANFNALPAPPQPSNPNPPPAPPQPSNFNPPPAPPQPSSLNPPPAPPQPATFNPPPAPPQASPTSIPPPPAPPAAPAGKSLRPPPPPPPRPVAPTVEHPPHGAHAPPPPPPPPPGPPGPAAPTGAHGVADEREPAVDEPPPPFSPSADFPMHGVGSASNLSERGAEAEMPAAFFDAAPAGEAAGASGTPPPPAFLHPPPSFSGQPMVDVDGSGGTGQPPEGVGIGEAAGYPPPCDAQGQAEYFAGYSDAVGPPLTTGETPGNAPTGGFAELAMGLPVEGEWPGAYGNARTPEPVAYRHPVETPPSRHHPAQAKVPSADVEASNSFIYEELEHEGRPVPRMPREPYDSYPRSPSPSHASVKRHTYSSEVQAAIDMQLAPKLPPGLVQTEHGVWDYAAQAYVADPPRVDALPKAARKTAELLSSSVEDAFSMPRQPPPPGIPTNLYSRAMRRRRGRGVQEVSEEDLVSQFRRVTTSGVAPATSRGLSTERIAAATNAAKSPSYELVRGPNPLSPSPRKTAANQVFPPSPSITRPLSPSPARVRAFQPAFPHQPTPHQSESEATPRQSPRKTPANPPQPDPKTPAALPAAPPPTAEKPRGDSSPTVATQTLPEDPGGAGLHLLPAQVRAREEQLRWEAEREAILAEIRRGNQMLEAQRAKAEQLEQLVRHNELVAAQDAAYQEQLLAGPPDQPTPSAASSPVEPTPAADDADDGRDEAALVQLRWQQEQQRMLAADAIRKQEFAEEMAKLEEQIRCVRDESKRAARPVEDRLSEAVVQQITAEETEKFEKIVEEQRQVKEVLGAAIQSLRMQVGEQERLMGLEDEKEKQQEIEKAALVAQIARMETEEACCKLTLEKKALDAKDGVKAAAKAMLLEYNKRQKPAAAAELPAPAQPTSKSSPIPRAGVAKTNLQPSPFEQQSFLRWQQAQCHPTLPNHHQPMRPPHGGISQEAVTQLLSLHSSHRQKPWARQHLP